jgi:hypothetical protein
MVVRRSLRELTTTAIALFLVLLGILFTNWYCVCWPPGGMLLSEGILVL